MFGTITLLIILIIILIIYFITNKSKHKNEKELIDVISSKLNPNKITLVGKKKYKGFIMNNDFSIKPSNNVKSSILIPEKLKKSITSLCSHPISPEEYVFLFDSEKKIVYTYDFIKDKIIKVEPISVYTKEPNVNVSAATTCPIFNRPSLLIFDEISGYYYIYVFAYNDVIEKGTTRLRWPNIPNTCKIGAADYIDQNTYADINLPLLLINEDFDKYLVISLENGDILNSGKFEI